MTADPSIIYYNVTKTSYDTTALVLISNTGTQGVIQGTMYIYSSGTCQPGAYGGSGARCVPSSINPYINQLYSYIPITTTYIHDVVCIKTWNCSTGDNCAASTCDTWNSSAYSTVSNIPVGFSLGIIPNSVGNLSATPGDKQITFSWNAPTNTSIFGYSLELTTGTTQIISGYVPWNRTSVVVSNIVNGTPYTLKVTPRSEDAYLGASSSVTATPVVTCVQPTCSFNVL